MPVTRRSARKATTRANTKRTILAALDENRPASIEQLKVKNNSDATTSSTTSSSISSKTGSHTHAHALPDINVLSPSSIHALLDDIKREVNARQECLSIKRAEIAKNQEEVYFLNTMKIEKSVKKMTVREFNAKFMNKELISNVDLDANANANGVHDVKDVDNKEESKKTCIIDVLKSLMISTNASSSTVPNNGAKKRVRGAGYTNLETPVRQLKIGKTHYRTPGTILRTARKGEVMYSSNGSPLESNNEGDLVATVCKKRRDVNANTDNSGEKEGGANEDAAAEFDINIGDGRYITLGDPSTMEHLTVEMKNTAKNQLHVLQDQLSKLLSHLN